ncbi:MAG: nitrous oxide-stimulated promoter family protein [Gammaproteobacteria bacterium]|nr:nitrous oxide-stimulated promoter family protein [Gammaproteobacteria bacterium]NNL00343.1 nitrous oxide-stimulated promoter family protein [Xanthomonadales bacterium]
MEQLTGRLRSEHKTLVCMTKIYCEDHHGQHPGGLCGECAALMEYSAKRLAKCPYGEDKPTCANCPIHCYKQQQRELVREVMRYAGPRMPLRHPWRALTHVFDKLRRVVHPRELRRARNRDRQIKP